MYLLREEGKENERVHKACKSLICLDIIGVDFKADI